MVERYATDEMARLWTEDAKYAQWLKVELAAVRAWNKLGLVDDSSCALICNNACFDAARIAAIEKTTHHDVIAFLTSVAETLGEESRFLHYGMTSSDTIDTALALQIRDSLCLVLHDIDCLLATLQRRALEFKDTLCVGRSHGIHGEPISFGLVVAHWFDDICRAKVEIESALKCISVGKMSGAMGNFAHAPLEFEELTCAELGLMPAPITTQVIDRARHAKVITSLALLAASCEKIAVAIRHFQRTEVYEAEEYFSPGQKGSSAMPHKRNPVLSENVTGLCRVIRGFVTPALENVALWHERDISHSSVERFVFPDIFITTDFMLRRLERIVAQLVVYPQNMLKNLNLTGGLVFSQRILLELPKKGLSREQSYAIVQRNAMKVWEDLQQGKPSVDSEGQSLFLCALLGDSELTAAMSSAEIAACFDTAYYTKNIDAIFARIFTKKDNNAH